ncbi:competence protein ComK [Bacillaceae bacterium S4-13-58]
MITAENYEVNSKTMALLYNEATLGSIIIETEQIKYCRLTPNQIIKRSCILKGISYEMRRESSRRILKKSQMLPIVMESYEKIIVFPTSSPRNDNCDWLCFNHIIDNLPNKYNKKYSIVIFSNSISQKILAASTLIDRQLSLCGLIIARTYYSEKSHQQLP